jgi:hypothetical protein
MSQQSVRQAARRSALDAHATLRKGVRHPERRAGKALRTMTDDEGLSLCGAVDWCGGGVTVREIPGCGGSTAVKGRRSRTTYRMSAQLAWPHPATLCQ